MKLFKCTLTAIVFLSTHAVAQTAGAPLALKDSAVDMSLTELEAAAQHLKGSGIVATGGELVDKIAGSGLGEFRGSVIRVGDERMIKAGDVVFVPPGVPHGINQTNSIVYLNIRFELRDED